MNRKYKKDMSAKLVPPDEVAWTPDLAKDPDYQTLLKQGEVVLEEIPEEINSFLTTLNQDEQSVFLLRSLGELTYTGIAEILKIPISNVMDYLTRARYKLREKLYSHAKSTGYL